MVWRERGGGGGGINVEWVCRWVFPIPCTWIASILRLGMRLGAPICSFIWQVIAGSYQSPAAAILSALRHPPNEAILRLKSHFGGLRDPKQGVLGTIWSGFAPAVLSEHTLLTNSRGRTGAGAGRAWAGGKGFKMSGNECPGQLWCQLSHFWLWVLCETELHAPPISFIAHFRIVCRTVLAPALPLHDAL